MSMTGTGGAGGTRHVLMLDLANDPALIAEYEAFHAPGGVWPEVLAGLRRASVTGMRIYRLGTRLTMVMEAGPGFDASRKAAIDAADPRIAAWETLMWRYQRAAPGARPGEKWAEMTEIFRFDADAEPPPLPDPRA